MAYPDLQPVSKMSKSILPANGTAANVTTGSLPFGVYVSEEYWSPEQIDMFKAAAAEQVAFVYKKLGGDVLDIELVETQVYSAYEEATLEYSYLLNLHQGRNILSRVLGGQTGSFNGDGQLTGSEIDSSVHAELKYPKFNLGYADKVSRGYSTVANLNGDTPVYSASFSTLPLTQDYDLQAIVEAAATQAGYAFSGSVNGKRINIKKVYYKTVAAGWFFFGYFGGLNVVGNLSTYGQYADDSTFEVIPVWQNKLQAMAYKDAIKTRVSDYSFQLKNNKLRIFPTPTSSTQLKFWFEFSIPEDVLGEESGNGSSGVDGINNINSIPFQNLPFNKINAIGKQWIRRYALSLCKEMLGYIRSKFASIPIPGESVQLNGATLVSEAKAEQTALKEELNKMLEETTYDKLAERDATIVENASKMQGFAPNLIFIG
jgi:hypothetical protein